MRWGLTYDDVIGEAERIRLGDTAWSRRVLKAIESLWPVFRWDKLYLGGGNSARIVLSVRGKLGDNVVFVPNAAGMNGDVRAWAMAAESARTLSRQPKTNSGICQTDGVRPQGPPRQDTDTK